MSGFPDYDRYDGLGLAELVKKKEVTATELCEEAISRIDKLNPSLNAVVTRMDELGRATARAALPDGPFAGVPFLLKDLLAAYAGVPLTSGSRALRDYVPAKDSELVTRFKRAGLVVLGKTNTPEFGLMGYTEPELFGPCRNPWNRDHTPGGSSGGSASAVAAGIVPLASGGDGGGSIRIPASCCGLFGLKPTRGRNPMGPVIGESWQGAVSEHVLTRTVRDSAAMLDATQGADAGAPYVIQRPARPYLEELAHAPRKLRIGFTRASPINKGTHGECVAAVEKTVSLLHALGHTVEEAQPKVNGEAVAISYFVMCCAEVAADVEELGQRLGSHAARSSVELPTRTLALLGSAISAGEFVTAMREWSIAGRALGEYLTTYDLYLTPTMARPPVTIGELQMKPSEKILASIFTCLHAGKLLRATGMVEKVAVDNLSAMPFTQLANLTGTPAMSVPLHWSADGLPIGVQFIAPFGDEATLFSLAAQLEKAAPWFDKRPPRTLEL